MISRRRALLLAPSGILAVGLAGAAAYMSLKPEPGVPIGGPFVLHDGDGRRVTEQQFRGRWMLVYFGYTHCPDACPTALQDMATAMDQLGDKKKDVALVFITVDPERDTPAVVKDYVSAFEAGITALSGSAAEVADAARAYRVYYAKHPTKDGGYDMDHSSIIYLMDPEGRFVANFTHETPPDQIAAKLRGLV
ncbi:MAG: SCO family protein [Janthinobacterium lividum]